MKIKQPALILFEGIDGSGKTSLSQMLINTLEAEGIDTLHLREPSDSVWGRKIRELASRKDSISINEELDYFIRDRKWNVKHNLLPALSRKKVVVLDRYYLSTACYQGARGLDMDTILETNKAFAPEPDIIFLIDVDVATALDRIGKNRPARARLFEQEEFLKRVRQNYLSLTEDNLYVVDGSPPLEEVFYEVMSILKNWSTRQETTS